MSKRIWLVAFALAAAACGSGTRATAPPVENHTPAARPAPPPPPPKSYFEEAMDKMESFRGEMCACTEKTCADRVQDKMNRWAQEEAQSERGKQEKPTQEQMKRMTDVGMKYADCMVKAMQAGAGSAPPPPGP